MPRVALSIALISPLTACGGGGGGGGGTPSNGGSSDKSAAGIWNSVNNDTAVGLIDENQHALIYIADQQTPLMLQCPLNISGNQFSCQPDQDFRITGTISEKNLLTGNISFQNNIIYSFRLGYVDLYDNGVPFSRMTGNWVQNNGEFNETIDIEADGDFTGQDSNNCTIVGEFDYFDPDVNVHTITYDVTNCPEYNGTYSGKGVYLPAPNNLSNTSPSWLVLSSSQEWIRESIYILEN